MFVVGIDCATQNRNTGLAFASQDARNRLTVHECFIARPAPSVAAQVHSRLSGRFPVLLALDAPLGWPAAFGTHLSTHRAGEAFPVDGDRLFRRHTDLAVWSRLHKAPLEVAANFLARTAVVALRTLRELSELCGTDVKLAWQPPAQDEISAIEVYPAGTLRAYQEMGFISRKGSSEQGKRALLRKLQRFGRLAIEAKANRAVTNEHVLDSVLCCVAALDFIEGLAVSPGIAEMDVARKEGWIWVRNIEA